MLGREKLRPERRRRSLRKGWRKPRGERMRLSELRKQLAGSKVLMQMSCLVKWSSFASRTKRC